MRVQCQISLQSKQKFCGVATVGPPVVERRVQSYPAVSVTQELRQSSQFMNMHFSPRAVDVECEAVFVCRSVRLRVS